MLTDHKPLTHSLNSKPDRHSPHQVHQLDFISQFTTDICHVTGLDNPVADVLSRVEANAVQLDYTPPTVDFDAKAKAQSCDADMQKLQSSTTILKLIRVPMPMCSDTILCDNYINGDTKPHVPEQFCRIVFDSLGGISHPGVQATQHPLCVAYNQL